MKAKRVIQSFCLLLVAASVAMGQKVNVDWNRGADFLRYQTYAWGICEIPEELELWQGRIVQNVEAQLAARGFRKAAPGQQPDVIVSYRGDVEERVFYVGYDYGPVAGWGLGPSWGPGWGPRWGLGWGGPFTTEPVVERQFELAVELRDARWNQLVWRGVATDDISRKSEKNIKRLRKAVAKLFEDYPLYRR
jgi:hypothetical protein